MQLLHYNILNGFNGCTIPFRPFLDYLKSNGTDILCLNEYRSHPQLDDALHELGYKYTVVNENHNSPNRVAIFSRLEIQKVIALPDWCRLVWIEVGDLNMIAYHASPLGIAEVTSEVTNIIGLLEPVTPIIICGDFNSLSQRDADSLEYSRLPATAGTRYCEQATLNFSALEMFEAAGFLDHRGPGTQNTVPTAHYRDHEMGATLRLDYVLSKNVQVTKVEVVREEPFKEMSDHFPISFSAAT